MNRLLVVGIGAGMDRSLAPIREMGVELVVVTPVVTPRIREAGRVVVADPTDAQDVVSALAREGIDATDGVMSLGCDNPPVVARLCAQLQCPGLSETVARDCTRKDHRIQILTEAGLPMPRHAVARDVEEAQRAITAIGLPVVIKPVDRTASVGITKVVDPELVAPSVSRALALSGPGRVLIEEFLTGTEHTVTGFSIDGEVIVTGFSDRDYRDKERFFPYFFESGDTVPTRLAPVEAARVEASVRRAVQALNLNGTFFNTDVLVTSSGRIVPLEVTGRLTGARIATEVVPLATGLDPLRNVVRLALGQPLQRSELQATRCRAVVQRFVPCTGGVVRVVGDIEAAPRPDGVYDLFWCLDPRPGLRLPHYRSADDVLAGVIAVGDTVADAERAAAHALVNLPIEIAEE